MDRFPKMVYRFPAQLADAQQMQDGIYDALIVEDEVAHDNALDGGWSETPADARDAAKLAEAGGKAADISDDGMPATRAELEQKATELGIEFSPKIGDAKLAERIAAKLAEAGA
jgi:hypothetical protein